MAHAEIFGGKNASRPVNFSLFCPDSIGILVLSTRFGIFDPRSDRPWQRGFVPAIRPAAQDETGTDLLRA